LTRTIVTPLGAATHSLNISGTTRLFLLGWVTGNHIFYHLVLFLLSVG